MARFEIRTYAKVIATGRIGEVTHRERTRVTIEFFDKSVSIRRLVSLRIMSLC